MIQLFMMLTFLILKFPQSLSWIETNGKEKWRASTMVKTKSQYLGFIYKKIRFRINKANEVKLYIYTKTFVITPN